VRAFYDRDVHGELGAKGSKIPSDVVQIPNARWSELLDANSKGMDIVPDKDGFPQAVKHAATNEQLKASLPFRRAVALRRAGELIEHHRDTLELGNTPRLAAAQYKELITYRAAVRAATEELPAAPSFLGSSSGS
jgi:hypothetical protein